MQQSKEGRFPGLDEAQRATQAATHSYVGEDTLMPSPPALGKKLAEQSVWPSVYLGFGEADIRKSS